MIKPEKWLEDSLQMFVGHAWAAVANREKHALFRLTADSQIHLDIAAWRTEPDGVANYVLAGASECMRIGICQNYRGRRVQAYGFPKRLRLEVPFGSYLLDQLREIHAFSRSGR
ncbi:MAG: hypothetical protein QOJ99_5438 [Bryobacterales bacterium]|nr:hypothetical protein [Bryobacterales bacterium]